MLSVLGHQAARPAEITNPQRSLIAAIAGVLDAVYEPCALARGCRMGLVSAGLVRCVRLRSIPDDDRVCVEIHASTTSHACMMYLYFEREVRRGLVDANWIATLDFVWSFGEGRLHALPRSAALWVHEQNANGWSTWWPYEEGASADAECEFRGSASRNANCGDPHEGAT